MMGGGFSEEELADFKGLSGVTITPEHEIKSWSVESVFLNPWISVRDWLNFPEQISDKSHGAEAYWIGSDAMVRTVPGILLKLFARTERYCKGWLYSEVSDKVRMTNWMGRGKKHQFPCATGFTVKASDSDTPPGYHFLKTFPATSWTPAMMSV